MLRESWQDDNLHHDVNFSYAKNYSNLQGIFSKGTLFAQQSHQGESPMHHYQPTQSGKWCVVSDFFDLFTV